MWRLKILILFAVLAVAGCSLEEHEVQRAGHSWSFMGVLDDSTAAVKVTYWESGEIHDHHIMGYDDDFHRDVSLKYYAVRMNSYWISSDDSRLEDFSRDDDTGIIPKWCDSCYVVGKIDGKTYGVKSSPLDIYSDACAVILVDEKKTLDSLELESCSKIKMHIAISFEAHYLKVENNLYEIRDGKFPSQRPAYKVQQEGCNIKFTDSDGDYIVYGGAP